VAAWPSSWTREIYSSWRSLDDRSRADLGEAIAMEYSRGEAVPYLDRIPAGVIDMVRDGCDGRVVGRARDAILSGLERRSHRDARRAAEAIAGIAREALGSPANALAGSEPLAEARGQVLDPRSVPSRRAVDDHGPTCRPPRTRRTRTMNRPPTHRASFVRVRSC
jgi:hypothetical protein